MALGIVAFAIVSVSLFGVQKLRTVLFERNAVFFHEQTLLFQQRVDSNTEPGRIVFIGDSIIQGMTVDAITPLARNYGIGLDTVSGLASRILNYSAVENSSLTVIAIGINDILRNNGDAAIHSYQLLLEELASEGRFLVCSVLNVSTEHWSESDVNNQVNSFNEQLELLVSRYANVEFISMDEYFQDSTGGLKDSLHTGDGLHLNQLGNLTWIKVLKTRLSEMNLGQ